MVRSRPLALVTPMPHAPEKFRIGEVVDSVRLPPFGADGFAYSKCVKSFGYFRPWSSEMPC